PVDAEREAGLDLLIREARREQGNLRGREVLSRGSRVVQSSLGAPDQLLGLAPVPGPLLLLAVRTADEVARVAEGAAVVRPGKREAGQSEARWRPVRPARECALVEPESALEVALVPENVRQAGQDVPLFGRGRRRLLVQRQRFLGTAEPVQQDGEVQ